MRHGVKKIKFSLGRDANRMLMRKLASNFIEKGKIETTIEKAKSLRSYLEKLFNKSVEKKEANKNWLLKKTGNIELVNRLFNEIGPKLKNKTGGHIRIIKLGKRLSDRAEVAKLEWTLPVVIEKKVKLSVKKKNEVKNNKNV